jgi:hypothetical protein
MVETLSNLKNNRVKQAAGAGGVDITDQIKKSIANVSKLRSR